MITEEEKARRRRIINFAVNSAEIESGPISSELKHLYDQYADGRIEWTMIRQYLDQKIDADK